MRTNENAAVQEREAARSAEVITVPLDIPAPAASHYKRQGRPSLTSESAKRIVSDPKNYYYEESQKVLRDGEYWVVD